jgi:hypothetical protein
MNKNSLDISLLATFNSFDGFHVPEAVVEVVEVLHADSLVDFRSENGNSYQKLRETSQESSHFLS